MGQHQQNIAFIFPGQGAQYVGMGQDFYTQYSSYRHTFEEANDILGYSISTIALEGPEKSLTETLNSQIAIYTMSSALVRVLKEQFPQLAPNVCAGLSLGEYSAITASGKLSFNQCLPIVKKRGQFMNDACEKTQGTMAVVMGLDADIVENMVKEINLPNDLWSANFNCPGQVVISGTQKGIEVGSQAAKDRGAKRVIPLQVHGAFHSGLMKDAQIKLTPYINELSFIDTPIQIAMNVPGDYVDDLQLMRQYMAEQVTNPVRWEMDVRAMDKKDVNPFIEIGCGKTLAGMNKRIGVSAPTISIEKVEDLELLAKSL
ncbi:MAG: ACP S-malonyltransferase [Parachlamydiales bacterium]|nr:ACP S-malonyltransferase [Parachlamydiales bacterium]